MADEVKTRLKVEGADAIQELERVTAAEARHANAVEQTGVAAERSNERRGTAQQRLKQRLDELALEETRHQQRVRRGTEVSNEDRVASERRQAAIERIATRLRTYDEANRLATDAVRRHTEATEEANDEIEKSPSLIGAAATSLGGLAASIVGGAGVAAAYREWVAEIEAANQRLRENAALTRENAQARLEFVALQGVEDPQEVQQINRLAAFAGRRPGEVFSVASTFKGFFPDAPKSEIDALVAEVASFGQQTTAPLLSLAGPLAAVYRETGDVRSASNILFEAFQQAGEPDPARVGQSIGQFIGIGRQIGGLSAAESAGFAAAGTSLGLPNEVATTGLKNVAFAIRGRGTPEGTQVLEREGINRDSVLVALEQIGQAVTAGRITPAELESLGGREAAPVFAALSDPQKFAAFRASVSAVVGAGASQTRLVGGLAESLFGAETIQGLNLVAKQAASEAEAARSSSPVIAQQEAARQLLEQFLAAAEARGEVSAADIGRIQQEFDYQLAQGRSVSDALAAAELAPSTDRTYRNPFTGQLQTYAPVGGSFSEAAQRAQRLRLRQRVLTGLDVGPMIEPPGGESDNPFGRVDLDSPFTGILRDPAGGNASGGGRPVIDRRTIIHTQINHAADPAMVALRAREPQD